MLNRIIVLTLAFGVTGCASLVETERVEYGGTSRPTEIAGPYSSCDDWEFAEFYVPGWSGDLLRFMIADAGDFGNRPREVPVTLSYSILEDGSLVNIRLVEPMWYTNHAAYREAPKAVGEALSRSSFRYEGTDEVAPAIDCSFTWAFSYDTNPD